MHMNTYEIPKVRVQISTFYTLKINSHINDTNFFYFLIYAENVDLNQLIIERFFYLFTVFNLFL